MIHARRVHPTLLTVCFRGRTFSLYATVSSEMNPWNCFQLQPVASKDQREVPHVFLDHGSSYGTLSIDSAKTRTCHSQRMRGRQQSLHPDVNECFVR